MLRIVAITIAYENDVPGELQPVLIGLPELRKHCRPERVEDLLEDLAVLAEDVADRRRPEDKGRARLAAVPRSRWSEDEAMDFVTVKSIETEFPGWEAWQGVDRRWHARIRGATLPVMVHDDDLVGLREEIQRKISQMEQAANQQDRRWRRLFPWPGAVRASGGGLRGRAGLDGLVRIPSVSADESARD
jgi:hypothetical protein